MAATMMMTGIIMFPQLGSRLQLRASCSWVVGWCQLWKNGTLGKVCTIPTKTFR